MRLTEFWARMEAALGTASASTWAEQQALTELGSRTVSEALAGGESPKRVWAVVWRVLELPESQR